MASRTRWAFFTDKELRVLYDELTMDDGIRYGVEKDDEPLYTLVEELRHEAEWRSIGLDR